MGWPRTPLAPGGLMGWPCDRLGGLMGWPCDRLGRGTLMTQLGDRLVNSLGSSTTNRLDNRAADRTGSCLGNRLGKQMDSSSMLDRVVSTTTAVVELKLPLTQQVGGTRRGVTGEASRMAKATAQRQSNLSHSSPSGRMRRMSKYRPKKRPRETSTCTGT